MAHRYCLDKSFLTWGLEEVLGCSSAIRELSEMTKLNVFSSINMCTFFPWMRKVYYTFNQNFKGVWGPRKFKASGLQLRSKKGVLFTQILAVVLRLNWPWNRGLLTHIGVVDKKPLSRKSSEEHRMSCLKLANRQALLFQRTWQCPRILERTSSWRANQGQSVG